jgi:AAA+ superfamily predicted ATPase
LIFIDDIDANILRDRKETHNPLTSQFLTCLDGLDKREGRVIVVSTNECLDSVDLALTRPGRFEHTIHIEYPTIDLIQQFCDERDVNLNAKLFENWSFARIDMFLSKFKVAEFRYGTSLKAFYEKFIYEMGATDPTVEAQE